MTNVLEGTTVLDVHYFCLAFDTFVSLLLATVCHSTSVLLNYSLSFRMTSMYRELPPITPGLRKGHFQSKHHKTGRSFASSEPTRIGREQSYGWSPFQASLVQCFGGFLGGVRLFVDHHRRASGDPMHVCDFSWPSTKQADSPAPSIRAISCPDMP